MQHSSLLTGSFWVYKLAWNGPRQTLGATKKPKQRDWNLNSQSRKESWNTVSLEECQKMTRLPVRSKFWVRVRVTATRRFVDLNGLAKASTWASCQVSNFSNQINPRQKKVNYHNQQSKKKLRTPARAWHSIQKSRSIRPPRKSRSAMERFDSHHNDHQRSSKKPTLRTFRTSGNKLPSTWQLAWADHFSCEIWWASTWRKS